MGIYVLSCIHLTFLLVFSAVLDICMLRIVKLHFSYDTNLILDAILQINSDLDKMLTKFTENVLKLNIENCTVLLLVSQTLSESGV